MQGGSSVMFTSYPPMEAAPHFYLGLILFAVGALIAIGNFFATLVIAKEERTYEGSIPLVTFGALTIAFDERVLRPREWTVAQSEWAADLMAQDPNVELVEATGSLHYTMPMNTTVAPFDDNNVRMALKYAIDREDMVEKILRGHGVARIQRAARGYTRGMGSGRRLQAQRLIGRVEPTRAVTVLDAWGGDGYVARQLCTSWPESICTVLEVPAAAAIAREACGGHPRIGVVSGDLLHDELLALPVALGLLAGDAQSRHLRVVGPRERRRAADEVHVGERGQPLGLPTWLRQLSTFEHAPSPPCSHVDRTPCANRSVSSFRPCGSRLPPGAARRLAFGTGPCQVTWSSPSPRRRPSERPR